MSSRQYIESFCSSENLELVNIYEKVMFFLTDNIILDTPFVHLWPESGEPSSYDTRPLFPLGLLDDDLNLSLLTRLGD